MTEMTKIIPGWIRWAFAGVVTFCVIVFLPDIADVISLLGVIYLLTKSWDDGEKN